jgi:zinc protease
MMKGWIIVAMSLILNATTPSPASASGIFNPTITKLSNGLQVVLVQNRLAPVVSISLIYKVGTADDPHSMHGLSHFLEHLMFKGTKDVPADQFKKLISSKGGSINAFTTPDMTAYICDIAVEHLEFFLKLEADRMQNLLMDPKEVEAEKKVVQEERSMRLDNNPFGLAYEALLLSTYWYHPYGIPAIGYPQHIEAYTRDAAYAHYKKWYGPNNAILVVAGDVTMKVLKPLVEKHFGSIPPISVPPRNRVKELDHAGITISIDQESPRISLINVNWSYRSPTHLSEGSKHYYPLIILAQVLGGNATSRLYRTLVEEHKIAVEASCSYDDESLDPQTFSLTATLAPHTELSTLKDEVEAHILEIVEKGITDKELADAKRDILASLAFARDGNHSSVMAFRRLGVDFTVEEIEDFPNQINAITATQAHEAAQEILGKNPIAIMTVYPQGYRKRLKEKAVQKAKTRKVLGQPSIKDQPPLKSESAGG